MRLFWTTAFFLLALGLQAQTNSHITAPEAVDQMMLHYITSNKTTPGVSGWRIQLLATTDRQKMESTLGSFRALYPYISVDWIHTQPYYKVRAGAFESKLKATRILYLVKKDYPSAYPAMDNAIKPEEFLIN